MSSSESKMKLVVGCGTNSSSVASESDKHTRLFIGERLGGSGCPSSSSRDELFDVYFGRSPTAVRATGNRRLRAIVDDKLPEYEHYRATNNVADRTTLISMVYKCIMSNGGRFLKKEKSGKWVEATTKEGRAKISHLFRDHKKSTSRTKKPRRNSEDSSVTSDVSSRSTRSIAAEEDPPASIQEVSFVSSVEAVPDSAASPDNKEDSTACTETTTTSGRITSMQSEDGAGKNQEMWEDLGQEPSVVKLVEARKSVMIGLDAEFSMRPLSPSFPPASIDVSTGIDEDFEPIPLGGGPCGIVNNCPALLDAFSIEMESPTATADCLLVCVDDKQDETYDQQTGMVEL